MARFGIIHAVSTYQQVTVITVFLIPGVLMYIMWLFLAEAEGTQTEGVCSECSI